MLFDLDQRTASLSVGEFSAFALGPLADTGSSGGAGLWRAQLGTHWHNALRAQALADAPATEFEVSIAGRIFHSGWTLSLGGRIDQLFRSASAPALTLREIKTVTRPLPADESELRAAYPDYFAQLATYAALARLGALGPQLSTLDSQLVFVEAHSGLSQTVSLTPADDTFFRVQLERVAEFLNLRHRARERLRRLRYRPAFATPRPGQETTLAELTALFAQRPLVFFEAPTGFGKTGVLLEFALGQLRSGHFDRALYLTSKSTGQLQVVRTLAAMTAARVIGDGSSVIDSNPSPLTHDPSPAAPAPRGVALWQVRNKSEHCINATFHCVRESCSYLADADLRWPASGLARFYLDENHPRDLDTLRTAGRAARICPYEITRAALAFNDVWIGDYNYVFAPRNRRLFYDQPGFTPARTLLLLDEAHNLPSRVADAYSHQLAAADALLVRDELHRTRALSDFVTAWDHWTHFLTHLRPTEALTASAEDDARHLLAELARLLATVPLDYATLSPRVAELLWQIPPVSDQLSTPDFQLPTLLWSPRPAELSITCLDAAPAIAATLREFGGVVFASATLTPVDSFAAACGLDTVPSSQLPALSSQPPPPPPPEKLGVLTKRDTKKLYRQLTTAADLLRVEEARDAASPALLRAHTPWRDGAYDIAFDARVDTTFQHRSHHYATTAATIAALCAAPSPISHPPSPQNTAPRSVAVFFPSYAYAESIAAELSSRVSPLTSRLILALQPRLSDLAAQTAWVEQSLLSADALFLVLGSSFAESIDLLGGRIGRALVVGPALPEVNPVQRARMDLNSQLSTLNSQLASSPARSAAFRRVYQIPGMTKVNQALGRLVRAPGQRARVILHCRRFLDPSYLELLAPDYRAGTPLHSDADLAAWLAAPPPR